MVSQNDKSPSNIASVHEQLRATVRACRFPPTRRIISGSLEHDVILE